MSALSSAAPGSAAGRPGVIEMTKLTPKTPLLGQAAASDPGAAASPGAGAGASASGGTADPGAPPARPRRGSGASSSSSGSAAPTTTLAGALIAGGIMIVLVVLGVCLFPDFFKDWGNGHRSRRPGLRQGLSQNRPPASQHLLNRPPPAAAEKKANEVPWKEIGGRWYLNGFGPSQSPPVRGDGFRVGEDVLVESTRGIFSKKAFHHSVFVPNNVAGIAHDFALLGGAGMLLNKPTRRAHDGSMAYDTSLWRGSLDKALVAKVTEGSKDVGLRTVFVAGELEKVNLRRYIPVKYGETVTSGLMTATLEAKHGDKRFSSFSVVTGSQTSIITAGVGTVGTVTAYGKKYQMGLMYTYQVESHDGKPVFTVEPAGAGNSYDVILEDVMSARVTKVLTGAGQQEEEMLHVEGVSRAKPEGMSQSQITGTWWTHSGDPDNLRHRLVEVAADGRIDNGNDIIKVGNSGKAATLVRPGRQDFMLTGVFGQNLDEIMLVTKDENGVFVLKEWWTRQDAKGNTPNPKWTCDITALTKAKPEIHCTGATSTEISNLAVTTTDLDVRLLDISAKTKVQENSNPGSQAVYRTHFNAPKDLAEYLKVLDLVGKGTCPGLAIRYTDGETPMYLPTAAGLVEAVEQKDGYKRECVYQPFYTTDTHPQPTKIWFPPADAPDDGEKILKVEVHEKLQGGATRTIEVTKGDDGATRTKYTRAGQDPEEQPADQNPELLFDLGSPGR